MSNDNLNKDVASSLAAMNADLSAPTPVNPTDTIQQMSADSSLPAQEYHPTITAKQQLKLFEEINMLMGEFLNSLKSIDAQFSQQANQFFKTASTLADKARTTKEEDYEMVMNIMIGGAIKGAGKIWNTWQTSKKLSEIKAILADEANSKLSMINDLKRMIPNSLEVSYRRFEEETDPSRYIVCLDNLRMSEYMNSIVLFLEQTYTAALNNSFQSTYPFPSYAPINRKILYEVLGGQSLRGNIDSPFLLRPHINKFIRETKRYVETGKTPDKKIYLFASDPQLMATAIYDSYPLEKGNKTIGDWIKTVESTDDGLKMQSEQYYKPFMDLYMDVRTKPDSPVSKLLLKNKTYEDTLGRIADISIANAEVEQNEMILGIIVILSAILGFLGAWVVYNIAWYWSIAIGIGFGFIMRELLPYQSLADKQYDKLFLIEKNIQTFTRKEMGDTKIINLAKLNSRNNSIWGFIIIGAIIGLFFSIVGAIPGAIIGGIIGMFIGEDDDEEETDYTYDHIRLKTSKKTWCLLILVIAALLYVIYRIIFH